MNSGKFSDRDAITGRGPVSFRRAPAHPSDEQTSLSEFAQVVAHRIGGLVSSIEGFTDLLIDGIDCTEDRETAFRILESVSRIEAILHDLKHYDDAIDVRSRLIPVPRLISGVFSVLADSEAERVRLDMHAADDVLVEVDERLVRQAMLSVIRNGLEASPAENPFDIAVTVDTNESLVQISMSNHGAVAGAVDGSRLFDAFYTTKAHNLGLGLTMARRFARLQGGDLRLAESPDADRTEFVMTLPLASEEDEQQTPQ